MSAALAFEIVNVALGALLFGWATHDAVTASTTAGRVCNAILAVEGIVCFVAALVALAGLVLA